MSIELKVPQAGESITEVTVVEWLKPEGAQAERDEPLALIETDKANVEVLAPERGVLVQVLVPAGQMAKVGQVIGLLDPSAAPRPLADRPVAPPPPAPPPAPRPPPAISAPPAPAAAPAPAGAAERPAPPSARRARREGLPPVPPASNGAAAHAPLEERRMEVVPMTPLRRRVAQRLLEAQESAALLTTFNEVDLSAVIALRKEHQEAFTRKHGVKLGFMSFFVKAAVEALRAFPAINAEIRGDDVIYHHYYDIGVAVGGGKGLVVPILRNAEQLGFADIEKRIADFGERAKAGRLKVEELEGGTFTLSNGGVYGSLMSTPIINPPQSGILGMHAIQERPVARSGAVVIAPMMYVALTYDHRIVDGREAVSFLVRIKECVEAPARLLLEL